MTAPPSYQTFQHFITHAPWSATRMWQILRAQLPERRGVLILLILDDTGFPKKGEHSVGVARQYSGTLALSESSFVAQLDVAPRTYRTGTNRHDG